MFLLSCGTIGLTTITYRIKYTEDLKKIKKTKDICLNEWSNE